MKKGFYTALGTPLDNDGNVVEESMIRHIEQQIEAGASGLLVMGSMGGGTYIKNNTYARVAEVSAKAAAGRIPVLIGVTDISIGRVMDRIEAVSYIDGIAGVASTVPYYATVNQNHIYNFYNEIANQSKFPVYLYDLAVITKAATNPDTIQKLWKNPNIKGIKSGNIVTLRTLLHDVERPSDFTMMYSNIDTFDIAYKYGIDKNLDGMFSCTPKTAKKMYNALDAGDDAAAAKALDEILALRDLLVESKELKAAFTHAMNLLGCSGNFATDYAVAISDAYKEKITASMQAMGEI